MELVKARLQKYHSYNEGRSFIVASMKAIDSKSMKLVEQATGNKDGHFIIKGRCFFKPGSEDIMSVGGDWIDNELSARVCLPSTLDDSGKPNIFELLRTEVFKSLDERDVSNMKKMFGSSSDLGKALYLKYDETVERLSFSDKKKKSFKEQWDFAIKNTKGFYALRKMDVEPSEAANSILSIKNCNSEAILRQLSSNPYEVVGFRSLSKVDDFFAKQPYNFDSSLRATQIVIGFFNEIVNQGSTCIEVSKFTQLASRLFKVDYQYMKNTVDILQGSGKLDSQTINGKSFIINKRYNSIEKEASNLFVNFMNAEWNRKDTSSIKPKEDFLNDEQREAVQKALDSKCMIISGGPGTGKTTVTKSVLDCIRRGYGDSIKIVCAAPTGKAAHRMSESTNEEAVTIHSVLKYNHEGNFNEDNVREIDADIVVIDEASMLDIELFRNLMLSIRKDARLILIGDVDQLDSVECGNVLNDLIKSESTSLTYLEINNRTDKDSTIVPNANLVKIGEKPLMAPNLDGDFHFIRTKDDEATVEKMVGACKTYITQVKGIAPEEIQVLTPQLDTAVGVYRLNNALKEVLNPPEQGKFQTGSIDPKHRNFRVGDRVIYNKNDRQLNITNGSVGTIKFIDMRNKAINVDFGFTNCNIPASKMGKLNLAYAKTIHKSQGSEYGAVIIPLSMANARMLNRKLIYTAITRAKSQVFLMGSEEALVEALKPEKQIERSSIFSEYLQIDINRHLSMQGRFPENSLAIA